VISNQSSDFSEGRKHPLLFSVRLDFAASPLWFSAFRSQFSARTRKLNIALIAELLLAVSSDCSINFSFFELKTEYWQLKTEY
jgi:hypothetical protein